MKKTKKQLAEMANKKISKIKSIAWQDGSDHCLAICKSENNENYKSLLEIYNNLNSAKKVYDLVDNKIESDKLEFSINIIDKALKSIYEQSFQRIRPINQRNMANQNYNISQFMTSGSTSTLNWK